MNFVDKSDGFSPSLDAHARGHVHVDSVSTHAPPGAIIVNDAQLLFTGEMARSGLDLVLSKDDQELVLHDYFKGEKRAPLASPDGAHLTGDIVNALTGYTQYAQAGGAVEPPKVIGHVSKLVGNATAIRNGVAIILNQGDNVNKGDVVQAGGDSTLGITFIDGTVFGLGSNAKMVLNEMIYDPNGSSNSSLMSLVQGTISFVAGATAKHGDMKVDTPVATMGIRGTAVLVEIDFDVQGTGGAPPARFQVLVEPDGTTGSYILFDKTTLNPIATVDQAGTQTVVNGQGTVSFLSSTQLSPDEQKIISDVFALKFTDNSNPNTKLTQNFTDSIIPFTLPFRLANGDTVVTTVVVANVVGNSGVVPPVNAQGHVAIAPTVVVTQGTSFTEQPGVSHSPSADTVTGVIQWLDVNLGDIPSASASFTSFTYHDAGHVDVTSKLTAEQLAAIKAVEIPLSVDQSPGNLNNGSATWTYSLADGDFDFLAAGETLTLTYTVSVNNNFAQSRQIGYQTFTITITGTNDAPVVTSPAQSGAITEIPGVRHSSAADTAHGTIAFTDPDLTDTHSVTIIGVTESGVTTGLADQATVLDWLSLGALTDSTDGVTGVRSWAFSAADDNFDYLAAGEMLTLIYAIQIDDHHGGVVTVPVTITITGTNDKPVITSPTQAAAITEMPGVTGSLKHDTASGAVTFTDVDLSDTHTVTVAGVTESGVTTGLANQATVLSWMSLGKLTDSTNGVTGSDAWTFSAADKSFDYLAVGETLTLTYTIQVNDHHGGVVDQLVTITITGTNDVPVITSAAQTAAITEHPGTTGSSTPDTASGAVTFTDVDLSDTHSVTITGVTESGVTTGLADQATVLSWLSLGALTDSTHGITGSDAWTFSAADKSFDYLAAGETLTLTYTIQVDDHHGGVVTQPVTITITGTNDVPVITSAAQTAAITEHPGTTGSSTPDTASGAVTFTDVDLSDTHSVTITGVTESGVTTGLADQAMVLSWLSLGALTDSTHGITGSDAWTFSAADKSFDYLAAGETLTLTYTIQVDDHHGGLVDQPVTITITGTNDAPVITSAAQTAAITEAAGTTNSSTPDTASGAVTFTDVDLSDTHSVTITGVTESGVTTGLADQATVMGWLSLGSLTDSTNGVTGSDAWTFSAADKSFDYLAAGETLTLTYTIQVDDHHGGVVTQPVTITITGTNDAPVITSAAQTAAITEIADTTGSSTPDTASGAVTFTDQDLSDTHSVTVTGVTESGVTSGLADQATVLSWLTLGSLTDSTGGVTGSDAWTFSTADKNFDYLAAGETLTVTYMVQVDDHHGGVVDQPVTITITGTDDVPVITSAPQTAAITELPDTTGSPTLDSVSGVGTFTDADLSDTHSVTITGVTESGVTSGLADQATVLSWLSLGTLTDSTNGVTGSVTGTFSAADKNFDYLAAGQTLTLTYMVQVDDHHGGVVDQPVTITVTGTNDAPVITSAPQSAAISDISGTIGSSTPDTATGAATFTDPDLSDTHSVTVIGVTESGVTSGLASQSTVLSWLTLGSLTDSTGGVTGSDAWTFSAADKNFDYLLPGEALTLTYMVQVDDHHGGTVDEPITITVTGSDKPQAFGLTVGEGGTTVLAASDFNVSDSSYTYTVSNVAGGQFEVFNGQNWVAASAGGFTAAQIAAGNVEFVQDGTATVPSFLMHVTDPENASADVAANVTLEIPGVSSQTVTFAGNGTLQLDDPANFAGKIAGIVGTGNVLDLKGFDAVDDTVVASTGTGSFDSDTDTTSLLVKDQTTGQSVTLQLAGNLSGSSWTVSDDHNGGVNVVDPPAGGHMVATSQTIVASTPNQTLTGTGASDTFAFDFTGLGHDTVTNFHPATDALQFGNGIFANAQAALTAAHDDGHGNTVITLDASDVIVLSGIAKAQLHAADFHFA